MIGFLWVVITGILSLCFLIFAASTLVLMLVVVSAHIVEAIARGFRRMAAWRTKP